VGISPSSVHRIWRAFGLQPWRTEVIGKLSAQHRAVDFGDFLDQIDRQADPGLTVHVICDNLSTHRRSQRLADRESGPRRGPGQDATGNKSRRNAPTAAERFGASRMS
jgi:hypothetical protein